MTGQSDIFSVVQCNKIADFQYNNVYKSYIELRILQIKPYTFAAKFD